MPHTPILATTILPSLRFGQVFLDEGEHFPHNRNASVATLRKLFAFGPECCSRFLRNRRLPSPESSVDTLVLVGIATDVAVESTARAACDLGYRTIVVSDACDADSDEAHTRALEVHRAWFGETAAAEVLSALGDERTDSGKSAEATRTAA